MKDQRVHEHAAIGEKRGYKALQPFAFLFSSTNTSLYETAIKIHTVSFHVLKVVTNSLCISPPKSTSTWLYAPARRRLVRIRVQSLEEACSFSSYSHRYTQGEEETLKSTEARLMCRCGGRFENLLSSVHAAELEEAKLKRLHKIL